MDKIKSFKKTIPTKLERMMEGYGFKKNYNFAEAIGISPGRLSNYLNQKALPDGEFFFMLKQSFPNIDLNDFFMLETEQISTTGEMIYRPAEDNVDYKNKYQELLIKYNSLLKSSIQKQ